MNGDLTEFNNMVTDKTFDVERALYGLKDALVDNCVFDGEKDGESALKETENLTVKNCRFCLRYPLWHTTSLKISDSVMTATCRAPLWYGKDLDIVGLKCDGVKALRECENVNVINGEFNSSEFCWKVKNLTVTGAKVVSESPFFEVKGGEISYLEMTAKYAFQYSENLTIRSAVLNTKDAFWHSKNVTVINSVIDGEYLGWYSENLTLINCTVKGTQPLCYAKNLKMIDCKTENCDLAFENSTVEVVISGRIDSVKNPIGDIYADEIGEVIVDDYCRGEYEITVKHKNQ